MHTFIHLFIYVLICYMLSRAKNGEQSIAAFDITAICYTKVLSLFFIFAVFDVLIRR